VALISSCPRPDGRQDHLVFPKQISSKKDCRKILVRLPSKRRTFTYKYIRWLMMAKYALWVATWKTSITNHGVPGTGVLEIGLDLSWGFAGSFAVFSSFFGLTLSASFVLSLVSWAFSCGFSCLLGSTVVLLLVTTVVVTAVLVGTAFASSFFCRNVNFASNKMKFQSYHWISELYYKIIIFKDL